MRLVVVLASLALSVLLAVVSRGHVLVFVLPLAVGLPLAGVMKGRR